MDQEPSNKRVKHDNGSGSPGPTTSGASSLAELVREPSDENKERLTYYEPLTATAPADQPGHGYNWYFIAPDSLREIGITELLDQDSRPTFIIDLQAKCVDGQLNVVFCNRSFRFFDDLRNVVLQGPHASSFTVQNFVAVAAFKEWALNINGLEPDKDGYLPGHTYLDLYWSYATLRGRWRVVSASHVPNRGALQTTPKSARPRSGSNSVSQVSSLSSNSISKEQQPRSDQDLLKQFANHDSMFQVLTELNPVGMYYLSPDGNIIYCNDMWYQITGHPRGLEGEMSFLNVISELDLAKMQEEWEILTTQKGRRAFPLRLRNPYIDPATGTSKQKWILASCDQEFEEDGTTLKSIMGCITDISQEKHAEATALERAKFSEKLARYTAEAAAHQKNFQQMAELAPSGMFTFDPQGEMTWANPQWYEMTGDTMSTESKLPLAFLDHVHKEDHDTFIANWTKLTVLKQAINQEMRFTKPWTQETERDGEVHGTTWILFLALPQLDENGNLDKILGCTTDISYFKWAESVQVQHRLEAEEAKRQQESFIDMTSHEMRNPLSAILQCADGIVDSLHDYKSARCRDTSLSESIVESNIDAAQTIVLCAQHQKRIIDDVLTLSKLNSAMLHVSPIQVQVEATVRKTLKMFEGEVHAHGIKMTFGVEASYREANIDWVLCDPVRLTQIFINLLTNAIKFTRSEDRKEIAVRLGASTIKPPEGIGPSVKWFPSKDPQFMNDLTVSSEWGDGEHVYLYFAVSDTGRGLSEEEMNRLFKRFAQASSKTHIQYGGSGLGLYISRELTELQGGEIGVASNLGGGSTFAFYIKARRSNSKPEIESSRSFAKGNYPTPWTKLTDLPSHLASSSLSDKPLEVNAGRKKYDFHFLLVEDNVINQKVTSNQLRKAGCTVHVANHGEEALSFLRTTNLWQAADASADAIRLDLILMDLEMPVMNGLTCTREIRILESIGQLRSVPVLAVTANARGEQLTSALEAGMDGILPKPFSIPELVSKTREMLLLKKW